MLPRTPSGKRHLEAILLYVAHHLILWKGPGTQMVHKSRFREWVLCISWLSSGRKQHSNSATAAGVQFNKIYWTLFQFSTLTCSFCYYFALTPLYVTRKPFHFLWYQEGGRETNCIRQITRRQYKEPEITSSSQLSLTYMYFMISF